MNLLVLLDAGPLGMISNPRSAPDTLDCHRWVRRLLEGGIRVAIPEVADYEVRRELLRAGKTRSVDHLDALKSTMAYIPITTRAMLKAAELWALARQRGRKTADDLSLDADVILAAQTLTAVGPNEEAVIATTNPRHLTLFARARLWSEIG